MEINRLKLKQALEIVKPGLAKSDIFDQATSFAFLGNRVVTYNDRISISHPIEGLDLIGAIRAEPLYKFLDKAESDVVSILQKEKNIIVKCGKAKATMTMTPEVSLPLKELGVAETWEDLPVEFAEAVSMTAPFCSKNPLKLLLSYMHVTSTVCEASDGYRALQFNFTNGTLTTDYLVPSVVSKVIVSLKPTQIGKSNGWIHMRTPEETYISCRTVIDTYPELNKHMQVQGTKLILPKSLNEVINRASIFAKLSDATQEELVISIKDKRFTVKSQAFDGSFEEEINFRYEGDPIQIHMTPFVFREVFALTQECHISDDRLRLYLTGSNWRFLGMLRHPGKTE